MSSNIIEQLKDDSKYYGDFGKQYLSNSDIYNLLKNPRKFRQDEKGLPLIMGAYFHTAMLEPKKIGEYHVIDVASRRNAKFKDFTSENNLHQYDVLLSKEVEEISTWVSAMKENLSMYEDIYDKKNVYEQPGVTQLFRITWKGKADIITKDKVIDIKTSSDINKFKWSANDYNYDSQAYIYQQIFGKPVEFYIVDKKSLMLKIAKPSEEALLRGRDKVIRAVEVYKKFFSEDSDKDPAQYIEYEQF